MTKSQEERPQRSVLGQGLRSYKKETIVEGVWTATKGCRYAERAY